MAAMVPGAAFELIGLEAVDPAATRIYRLLATATTGSIDLPGSLIELASELRAQRREEVERTASKRQLAMNGPIVFVTMPVLFMFIIVPTVSFLHGLSAHGPTGDLPRNSIAHG